MTYGVIDAKLLQTNEIVPLRDIRIFALRVVYHFARKVELN
jgi:hypothetical protein